MLHKKDKLYKIFQDIFCAESIAVVGASESIISYGYQYMRYLTDSGFKGKIVPVNHKDKSVLGIQAFASLRDIPFKIDYVICCVRADLVMNLLDECGEKGIFAVHLLTGKFSETGDSRAAALEEMIKKKAELLGIRLIGPNGMGVYCPKTGISFNHNLSTKAGNAGGIVQSGGVAGDIVRHGALRGIQFSKVVSYGNGLDLNECDLLEYLLIDPETEIIFMYIEGAKDGKRLIKILSEASCEKPVIIVKGGKGVAGSRPTASHTASIAGSIDSWETLYKQFNVISALNQDELLDLLVIFSMIPPVYSCRSLLIGGGGGKCVLSADDCEREGLFINPLPADVEKFIAEKDPSLSGWLGNPIDFSIFAFSPIATSEILQKLMESSEIDFIVANLSDDNPMIEDIWKSAVKGEAEELINAAEKKLTPLVAIVANPIKGVNQADSWRWDMFDTVRDMYLEKKIPVYPNASRAAFAIKKLVTYYGETKVESGKKEELVQGSDLSVKVLTEIESKNMLQQAGIDVNETWLAKNVDECADICEKTGYPVVLKIISKDISHKTDVGGVRLNIENLKDACHSFNEMMTSIKENYPSADISGISIQKMIKDGVEFVCGMNLDPQFGPVVMFGTGGVFVEILKDVCFRFVPINKTEAQKMISEIKHQSLIKGYRGKKGICVDMLADFIVKFSSFVASNKDLKSVDINPLIATSDGLYVVDSRVVL